MIEGYLGQLEKQWVYVVNGRLAIQIGVPWTHAYRAREA